VIRLIHDRAGAGAWNMAVDEALMRSAQNGRISARFYEWEPGCLSFGRNQAAAGQYDVAAATERGIDVVRRPTGGRTVYHHKELTYSVTAPVDSWGSLRDAYCRINHALAAGLQSLGVPVACAGDEAASAPRPTARACFRDPLPGEVTAGGRKLVGSAQWRDGTALLQHGSILLVNEQHVAEELRVHREGEPKPPAGDAHAGAIGLDDLGERVPPIADLVAALRQGFEAEFGVAVEPGSADDSELEFARTRLEHYEDPSWTWRR
jgi:lipoate-protein ligase A